MIGKIDILHFFAFFVDLAQSDGTNIVIGDAFPFGLVALYKGVVGLGGLRGGLRSGFFEGNAS